MNWKVFCLISSLTLAAVPAYANINNYTAAHGVFVAQSSQSGDTMMKPNTMMNGGTMMKPNTMITNPDGMIRVGSTGDEVKAAQSFLLRQGFYTGAINGIFDQETRAAVMKFQNSKKITPTGIIGPTTRAAMQL